MLALLTAGLLLAGCSTTGSTVNVVDPAEFAAVVAAPGTQVIDVRTPAEFAAGHLAGAVNLDVEAPGFAAEVESLDKSGTYAVYCRSGNRSQVATRQMAEAGIGTIHELDGGIVAWTGAGLPIEQ